MNQSIVESTLSLKEGEYEEILNTSNIIQKYADLVQHDSSLEDEELTEEIHQHIVKHLLHAFAIYGAHDINLLQLILNGLTESLLAMSQPQE